MEREGRGWRKGGREKKRLAEVDGIDTFGMRGREETGDVSLCTSLRSTRRHEARITRVVYGIKRRCELCLLPTTLLDGGRFASESLRRKAA